MDFTTLSCYNLVRLPKGKGFAQLITVNLPSSFIFS